jgi:hypothetical protein
VLFKLELTPLEKPGLSPPLPQAQMLGLSNRVKLPDNVISPYIPVKGGMRND